MANNKLQPDLKPTVDLGKFRFWCQKVLPLVYDDSISYYEVLGKMVTYLNQVIDNVNADTENVQTLKEAFDELAEYIDEIGEIDIRELTQLIREGVDAAEEALQYSVQAHESQESANQSAINAASAAEIASNMATSASGSAQNASDSATNAANSALNAISQASQAASSATSAQQSATTAESASTSAEADALKAEGLAVGQQNGSDVDSSSPYYHRNAKYYAEQAGQGAGAYPLADLPDTHITDPEQGQILAYDATTQKWVNSDDVQGVTSLDALTDTTILTPSAGQVLMYDSTTQKWVNADENEVAISAAQPSNPDTKLWINETEQTPVMVLTEGDLNGVQTQINTINSNILGINETLNSKADSTTVNNALAGKANKTNISTISAPTTLTVADNTEYYLTNVANLTISFPSGNFECWISITTASNFTDFNLPASAKYIGDQPNINANERWEVSIKNGVVIAGKAE